MVKVGEKWQGKKSGTIREVVRVNGEFITLVHTLPNGMEYESIWTEEQLRKVCNKVG